MSFSVGMVFLRDINRFCLPMLVVSLSQFAPPRPTGHVVADVGDADGHDSQIGVDELGVGAGAGAGVGAGQ